MKKQSRKEKKQESTQKKNLQVKAARSSTQAIREYGDVFVRLAKYDQN